MCIRDRYQAASSILSLYLPISHPTRSQPWRKTNRFSVSGSSLFLLSATVFPAVEKILCRAWCRSEGKVDARDPVQGGEGLLAVFINRACRSRTLAFFGGLARAPAHVYCCAFAVVIATIAIPAAEAAAELRCLACAYDALATADAVRTNLRRCHLVRFATRWRWRKW